MSDNNTLMVRLRQSQFIFHESNILEVNNAILLYTNFRGAANRFGNSSRHFNIVVTPDVAEKLKEMGARVNEIKSKNAESDPDELPLLIVDVKVNMESAYPPIITVYTDYKGVRSHNTIGLDTVSTLDSLDKKSVDCTINLYQSKKMPGHISLYLRKMAIIQQGGPEFDGKYVNWDSPSSSTDIDPVISEDAIDGDDEPKPVMSSKVTAKDLLKTGTKK